MSFKTFILLTNKRSGSTFIQNIFRKNKQVKLFHKNQKQKVVESQFWSLSSELLKKKISYLDYTKKIFNETKIDIQHFRLKQPQTENDIFNLWEEILNYFNSDIFDKSPQYLSSNDCLSLIKNYSNKSKRVKIIFLIRDPRDIITSQINLWGGDVENREKNLIKKLDNFTNFKKYHSNIHLLKYENFEKHLKEELKKMFNFCDIKFEDHEINKIKFNKTVRYQSSFNKEINYWHFSDNLKKYLKHYNYNIDLNKITFFKKILLKLSNLIKFKH